MIYLYFFFCIGGTGFVGRHLKIALKENGYKVTVVSRKAGPDTLTWVRMLWIFQNIYMYCIAGNFRRCQFSQFIL